MPGAGPAPSAVVQGEGNPSVVVNQIHRINMPVWLRVWNKPRPSKLSMATSTAIGNVPTIGLDGSRSIESSRFHELEA